MDRKDLDTPAPASGAPTVLIVSGESFGILLQHFLEQRGYRALQLQDARYALRLMRLLRTDLLITTLDCDEIDNVELLLGLSSERERPPVLLCSRQSSSPAILASAEALGVDQVLSRPCRFEVIARAVERLLPAVHAAAVASAAARAATPAPTTPEVLS